MEIPLITKESRPEYESQDAVYTSNHVHAINLLSGDGWNWNQKYAQGDASYL